LERQQQPHNDANDEGSIEGSQTIANSQEVPHSAHEECPLHVSLSRDACSHVMRDGDGLESKLVGQL
jgi:hypothetical protein